MSITLEDIQEIADVETDDSDQIAHIVEEAEMVRSFVTGEPVEALCGKKWVPSQEGSGRDVCGKCALLYVALTDFHSGFGGTRRPDNDA